MTLRPEVVLTMRFGPAATPVLPTAVEFARRHADRLQRSGERSWVASFRLGRDEERYGRALQLACMVYGWKSTTFDVGGSPEPDAVVLDMVSCAREWLRREGRCRATFGRGLPAKCRGCPLYDPEWALESCPPLPAFALGDDALPFHIVIPDVVPPEWYSEPPERVEYPTAQAYAAGLVAMHCVQEAASLDDDAVRATARRLRCTTFFGAFGLDADGRQTEHEMLVVQWQERVKAVVWPPRAAEASAVI